MVLNICQGCKIKYLSTAHASCEGVVTVELIEILFKACLAARQSCPYIL